MKRFKDDLHIKHELKVFVVIFIFWVSIAVVSVILKALGFIESNLVAFLMVCNFSVSSTAAIFETTIWPLLHLTNIFDNKSLFYLFCGDFNCGNCKYKHSNHSNTSQSLTLGFTNGLQSETVDTPITSSKTSNENDKQLDITSVTITHQPQQQHHTYNSKNAVI